MKLSDFDASRIVTLLKDLQKEATGFVRNCDADAQILADFKVYMRYTGQGWEIPITLTEVQASNPNADEFLSLFEADYSKLFGRAVEGLDVEITVWAVNATTPPQVVDRIAVQAGESKAATHGERQMFDAAQGKMLTTSVVLRDSLKAGHTIEGPSAVTEDETTIIIPASRRAVHQKDGCLDVMARV